MLSHALAVYDAGVAAAATVTELAAATKAANAAVAEPGTTAVDVAPLEVGPSSNLI